MTEYNPYGARHFLREGEAEGVSELRRRRIPLADGDRCPKGLSADTDELDARRPAGLPLAWCCAARRRAAGRPRRTTRVGG